MSERVTLVSIFNSKELDKINNIISATKEPLCKVPFIKNVGDRYRVDTLPYHFTISAWGIDDKNYIIERLSNIEFNKFKILVNGIEIMTGRENSYVLYFDLKVADELKILHQKIFDILPNKKYNPQTFKFHITITADKDYDKVMKIKNELEAVFVPFELEVDSIGLYEIYPANLVKIINAN